MTEMSEKKYRYLEFGELTQEGDEVDLCRDPWRDDAFWKPVSIIGEAVPDPQYPAHRIFRRPL